MKGNEIPRNMFKCADCGEINKRKSMKRIQGHHLCKKCASQLRKEKREVIKREVAGVKKRGYSEKDKLPKIKPIKQKTPRDSRMGVYLSKIEKKVLHKKYMSQGLDEYESYDKVNGVVEHLNKFLRKAKKEVKDKKKLNKRFKEEFERLLNEN